MIYMEVNDPPTGGDLIVTPLIGDQNTPFDFDCNSWVDPDTPLTYSFYIKESIDVVYSPLVTNNPTQLTTQTIDPGTVTKFYDIYCVA